jgi:hypothetical protein
LAAFNALVTSESKILSVTLIDADNPWKDTTRKIHLRKLEKMSGYNKKKKNRRRHDLCTKSVATRAGAGKKELLIYLQDFRKLSTEAGLAVFTITAMVSSAAASSGLAVAA